MARRTTAFLCAVALSVLVETLVAQGPTTGATGASTLRALRALPSDRPVRILVVYGVSPEFLDVVRFTQRLRLTVREETAAPVEFYQEYLDLDRFPNGGPRIQSYLVDKYRDFHVDAVVVIGSVALRFATEQLSAALPDIPVVFALTIRSQIDETNLPAHVTGRMIELPFGQLLAMAQDLQPDAERIAIVGGTSRVDSVAVAATLKAVASRPHPLDVVLLRGLTYDALLRRLATLPPRTIVVVAYFRQDKRGQTFIPGELFPEMTGVASAPVYTFARSGIGLGILGGPVIDPDSEGTAAGRLVMRALRRAPGEPLPRPVVAGTKLMADWRQLRRWGLSEKRLPPGTEVLFRTPGVWERYRVAILGSAAVMAVQMVLIGLLLTERRRRRRAQLALEEQLAYEQTVADIATDAAHVAPSDSHAALEGALARLGRYAGASRAVLVQYSDGATHPPLPIAWVAAKGQCTLGAASMASPGHGVAALEIPFVAEGRRMGSLALYRSDVDYEWPPRLVCRLGAAAELIAGAMIRSRATRAARAGEELNRAVLASLSAGIAILDRTGVVIRVNDAWRELARQGSVPYRRESFVGDNYLDGCRLAEEEGCEDSHAVRRGIQDVLERRACAFHYEYSWSSPDTRWCELRVDCLDHEDGGAIVTHLDITDRRLAALKAEETRRQVAHLGRVAMIGELAATVSHELRQPLAAIRANAESGVLLLSRDPTDVEEAIQIFRDIADDDGRAADIIDRTRTLLRNEAPKSAVVDVNEICRRAVHMLNRDALLRHARLATSLDAPASAVLGDPVQLEQVVLNLVLNALDAMAESLEERVVTVRTLERDGEVEISVHDSGPGLLPEVQRHLFESFYSTKTQGLGMGLVIVRSIVERHRGRVSAENDDAGGAVFRVVLPNASPTPAARGV